MSSRRLTLAEERELNANVIEAVAALEAMPRAEYERWLRERYGVAKLDQMQAASAETIRDVLAIGAANPHVYPYYHSTNSRAFGALLYAGVVRCSAQSRCEHVADGGRPLTCALAARVIACERCLPRFRGAIIASLRRNVTGQDRLCDLCLREPANDKFRPIIAHYGPVQVGGDVCDECWSLAQEDARAAA